MSKVGPGNLVLKVSMFLLVVSIAVMRLLADVVKSVVRLAFALPSHTRTGWLALDKSENEASSRIDTGPAAAPVAV